MQVIPQSLAKLYCYNLRCMFYVWTFNEYLTCFVKHFNYLKLWFGDIEIQYYDYCQ